MELLGTEMRDVCDESAQKLSGPCGADLAVKLSEGREAWTQSRLRHCLYPAGGRCTERTDYGAVTLHQCDITGLEGYLSGCWLQPEPPSSSCAGLFAGDMFERLTTGRAQTLKHRVVMNSEGDAANWRDKPVLRQSYIFFCSRATTACCGP